MASKKTLFSIFDKGLMIYFSFKGILEISFSKCVVNILNFQKLHTHVT